MKIKNKNTTDYKLLNEQWSMLVSQSRQDFIDLYKENPNQALEQILFDYISYGVGHMEASRKQGTPSNFDKYIKAIELLVELRKILADKESDYR